MSDGRLLDGDRREAENIIRANHYSHSVPSGKSYYIAYGPALVVWSLPANCNAARHFLPGVETPRVFELTRLWAPDGHERNLLTRAIAEAVRALKEVEPNIDLVMSYADPTPAIVGTSTGLQAGSRRDAPKKFELGVTRTAPAPSYPGALFTAARHTSTSQTSRRSATSS